MKKIFLSLAAMFAMVNIAQSQVVYTDLNNNPVIVSQQNMEYGLNFMGGEAEFMIQNYSAEGEAIYFASFLPGTAVVSTQADYNANVDVLVQGTVIGENSTFFGCEDGSPYFNVFYLPDTYTKWADLEEPQFIGFKFKNGNNTYYGWAEDSLETGYETEFVLYGYAYQSTPNTAIKAGDKGTNALVLTENDVKINVYPNPASESISIATQQQIDRAEIVNALGQKVLDVKGNTQSIDISSLERGVYTVGIYTQNGCNRYKFIKK